MNNALRVNIFQSTPEFGHPKAHRFLSKAFSWDMESQITAIHQIHHDITSQISATWQRVEEGNDCVKKPLQDAHIFYILEAVSQVAQEWVIQVLEHSPFTDDIPYTFRPNHCRRNTSVEARWIGSTLGSYLLLFGCIWAQKSTRYPFSQRYGPFRKHLSRPREVTGIGSGWLLPPLRSASRI